MKAIAIARGVMAPVLDVSTAVLVVAVVISEAMVIASLSVVGGAPLLWGAIGR
ncbi:MAG: hypothetical protein KBI47_11840 [Armatimonadetes bacterium]|nr:hypothetical protein [Armatimonadota bacterium]